MQNPLGSSLSNGVNVRVGMGEPPVTTEMTFRQIGSELCAGEQHKNIFEALSSSKDMAFSEKKLSNNGVNPTQ